ncbi:hypothetical protein MRB53_037920 [Persea americana]|nr:hypothetical protein MRB53_037920 [Persea americana]
MRPDGNDGNRVRDVAVVGLSLWWEFVDAYLGKVGRNKELYRVARFRYASDEGRKGRETRTPANSSHKFGGQRKKWSLGNAAVSERCVGNANTRRPVTFSPDGEESLTVVVMDDGARVALRRTSAFETPQATVSRNDEAASARITRMLLCVCTRIRALPGPSYTDSMDGEYRHHIYMTVPFPSRSPLSSPDSVISWWLNCPECALLARNDHKRRHAASPPASDCSKCHIFTIIAISAKTGKAVSLGQSVQSSLVTSPLRSCAKADSHHVVAAVSSHRVIHDCPGDDMGRRILRRHLHDSSLNATVQHRKRHSGKAQPRNKKRTTTPAVHPWSSTATRQKCIFYASRFAVTGGSQTVNSRGTAYPIPARQFSASREDTECRQKCPRYAPLLASFSDLEELRKSPPYPIPQAFGADLARSGSSSASQLLL